MSCRMSKLIITVLGVFIAVAAAADQAAWVMQETAESAVELLPAGAEYRYYCQPCGDTAASPETVTTAEVRYTGTEGMYEVAINDEGMDLAYIYVNIDGEWKNLALHLGLEVTGVDQTLAESGQPQEAPEMVPSFERNLYAGVVGKRRVMMELWMSPDGASGEYKYLHIGTPIDLMGSADVDGSFTLGEKVEESKTGEFKGTMSGDTVNLSGVWVSGDGEKTLDFSLNRFAVSALELLNVTTAGLNNEGYMNYPVFMMDVAPAYENLNTAVQKFVTGLYQEYRGPFIETVAGNITAPRGEDGSFVYAYAYQLNYMFVLYTEELVSLVFMEYMFGGGAHGNTITHSLNLGINSEGKVRVLALKDFFKDFAAAHPILSKNVIQGLLDQDAQWILDNEVKELKAEDLQTFSVSAEGLTFYFDPYDVGPYVQGEFQVAVPYSAIAEQLKEGLIPASIRK
ncbi:MAG: DUF3298 and DUF4163 domain-containing protein [Candidatus Hydrogenedentes bacterium]|nr:DUF3298 and DUF4163 domain-containing protein [Candidatus Hydrogenedentota bacterium]